MSHLLTLTAIIEAGTGLVLLIVPSFVVLLLLGASLEAPAPITLGRVAGAALVSLGMACWLARRDVQSSAARGVVTAMVLYNVCAVVVLGAVGIGAQPIGVALWPAVLLHAGMTVWCVVSLATLTSANSLSRR